MPASSIPNQIVTKKDAPGKSGDPVFPGDFLGPLTASLVSIPIEANYGIIALAPLGPGFIAVGVLAAIYCALISNLVGAFSTARPGLLGGTRPTLVLAIAVLIGDLAAKLRVDGAPDVPLILAFTMLTLAMAGIVQVLMSMANIGRLFKYMPYPVLAGFINGAALLILITAVRPLLGLHSEPSWHGFLTSCQRCSPARCWWAWSPSRSHCDRHAFLQSCRPCWWPWQAACFCIT